MQHEKEYKLTILGNKVFCREVGQGEPLLLLHGNGEDNHVFDKMIPHLQDRYRLLLPDTRGHGKSPRGKRPLHFEAFAQDAKALLDALNLPYAHIVGFSDGGNTAMHLGYRFPGRAKSLTLIGANMSPAGIRPLIQAPIVAGYALCSAAAVVFPGDDTALKRDILGLMVHYPNLTPEHLVRITAPTLLMAGERDIVKELETLRMANAIPHSRTVFFPKAGHFLVGKFPKAVCRHLLDFLAEIEQA